MAQDIPTQLYLISPLDVSGDFPQRLGRALEAGRGVVTAFQFRVKGLDQHEAAALAAPLQEICAAHDVAFIVNDSIALAKRLGADGVHLGQKDGDVREARDERPAIDLLQARLRHDLAEDFLFPGLANHAKPRQGELARLF